MTRRRYAAPLLITEGPARLEHWGLNETVRHLQDVRDPVARARFELWILAGRLILFAHEHASLRGGPVKLTPWMLERIGAA